MGLCIYFFVSLLHTGMSLVIAIYTQGKQEQRPPFHIFHTIDSDDLHISSHGISRNGVHLVSTEYSRLLIGIVIIKVMNYFQILSKTKSLYHFKIAETHNYKIHISLSFAIRWYTYVVILTISAWSVDYSFATHFDNISVDAQSPV